VVQAILYRLKTGCQWRKLPTKQFFRVNYKWQSVYYHYQKWSKDGSWENLWTVVLNKYKHLLDMSSIQLGGTHTPTKRGGESVASSGKKLPLNKPLVWSFCIHWQSFTSVFLPLACFVNLPLQRVTSMPCRSNSTYKFCQ